MLSFFHAPHCTTSTMTSEHEGGRMEERGKTMNCLVETTI